MNDFVVCWAAHIEFTLSDMSGGSGGGKRDAGLKVKALRIQDWGKTLNLRAQPGWAAVQETTLFLLSQWARPKWEVTAYSFHSLFFFKGFFFLKNFAEWWTFSGFTVQLSKWQNFPPALTGLAFHFTNVHIWRFYFQFLVPMRAIPSPDSRVSALFTWF